MSLGRCHSLQSPSLVEQDRLGQHQDVVVGTDPTSDPKLSPQDLQSLRCSLVLIALGTLKPPLPTCPLLRPCSVRSLLTPSWHPKFQG